MSGKKEVKKRVLQGIQLDQIKEFDEAVKVALDLEEILERKNREIAILKDELDDVRRLVKSSREDTQRMQALVEMVQSKGEQIDDLKEKITVIEADKKRLVREIERLKEVNKLDSLKTMKERSNAEINTAEKEARDKVAKRFKHLAKLIEENKYLNQDTLESFDFYREQLVEKCIEEKDLGEKVDNL